MGPHPTKQVGRLDPDEVPGYVGVATHRLASWPFRGPYRRRITQHAKPGTRKRSARPMFWDVVDATGAVVFDRCFADAAEFYAGVPA